MSNPFSFKKVTAIKILCAAGFSLLFPIIALAQSATTTQSAPPPVTLESCTPDAKQNPLIPVFGKLSAFNCSVKNAGTASTSVFMSITRKLDGSNTEASIVRIFVPLNASESTTTQIFIPAVFENGSYTYTFTLMTSIGPVDSEKEGTPFGNTLTLSSAPLNRPSMKISSATLDKTAYASGDVAKLSLSVLSSSGTTTQPYYVYITSINSTGVVCKTLLHDGPSMKNESVYTFGVLVDPLCNTTAIRVQILSTEGFPTDTKEFAMTPLGGEKQGVSSLGNYLLVGGVVAILLIMIGVYYYAMKRRSPKDVLPTPTHTI